MVVSGRFINNAIVNVFKDSIQQLRQDIGRQILVYFDPLQSGCPNSLLNPVTRTDSNTYNTDNPFSSGILNIPPFGSGTYNLSFPQGSMCPVCNGNGYLFAPSSISYQANISWLGTDEKSRLQGEELTADVEVKIDISGYNDLDRGKFFLVDEIKCVRVKAPKKSGLRDLITASALLRRSD